MNTSHRLRLIPAVAGAAVIALAAAACGSSGGGGAPSPGAKSKLTASAPGITPTTITIGSHQPLTGPAAPGYSEISRASTAYFNYVNAHGGVYGRKIIYKYLNDQYNPAITSTVVHQLVLQDRVYAIFNGLGTPTHLAVASYLNSQHVPDVFVASGCACWDNPSKWPDTFGWQINYVREGKILGSYIKQHFAGKKIGYFYQNDEFGLDGVKGLDYEIPHSWVVSRQSYTPTNVNIAPQVAAFRAAHVQVVVAFSIPAFTALLKLTSLKIGFAPQQLVASNVGTDPITLGGLLAFFGKSKKLSALTAGIITDGFLPSLGQISNPWIVLFKKIHDTYIPSLPFDGDVLYGEAVAYTFVQAMFKAGRNPTQADLVNAVNGGLAAGPSVAPYAYSATNHDGMTGAYIGIIKNGVVVPVGHVLVTDATPTGAITPDMTAQPPPPANGIP